MKPHEEAWEVGRDGAVRKIDAEGTLVGWTPDQTRLIAAAPEMARILLSITRGFEQGYRLTPAENSAIRALLITAGVL